jgi:hypothetical protein
MDHVGVITIKLGDLIVFPDNFEKLFKERGKELNAIFNISLAANPFHKLNYTVEIVSFIASNVLEIVKRKKIGERSI